MSGWFIALIALFGPLLTCAAAPVFETSATNGGWAEGGYYVHNNLWNCAPYQPCISTLSAWSHDNWQVVTRMNNQTQDGAVKTYPNVHKDFARVPVSAFASLTSTFAETSPHVGIYNVTYDLWLNGIAKPGCTEIMIWTENFHQTPAGRYLEEVTLDNRTYKVYKTKNSAYIAFVATPPFTSGTVNLLDLIQWTMAKGWLSSTSTVSQVCFGFEMVSTDDTDAKFQVTAFSVDAQQKSNQVAPASHASDPAPVNHRGQGEAPKTQ